MKHQPSDGDLAYMDNFNKLLISPESFHHREHLRIAYILICKYGVDEAHSILRTGIKSFLNHAGVDGSKYHETLTYAWILAIYHFMNISEDSYSFDKFITSNPVLLNKNIMNSHYSQSILMSEKAKQKFIKPDREPIPVHHSKVVQTTALKSHF